MKTLNPAADFNKLEHGCRMIHAGFTASVLLAENAYVSTLWLLLQALSPRNALAHRSGLATREFPRIRAPNMDPKQEDASHQDPKMGLDPKFTETSKKPLQKLPKRTYDHINSRPALNQRRRNPNPFKGAL